MLFYFFRQLAFPPACPVAGENFQMGKAKS